MWSNTHNGQAVEESTESKSIMKYAKVLEGLIQSRSQVLLFFPPLNADQTNLAVTSV